MKSCAEASACHCVALPVIMLLNDSRRGLFNARQMSPNSTLVEIIENIFAACLS